MTCRPGELREEKLYPSGMGEKCEPAKMGRPWGWEKAWQSPVSQMAEVGGEGAETLSHPGREPGAAGQQDRLGASTEPFQDQKTSCMWHCYKQPKQNFLK